MLVDNTNFWTTQTFYFRSSFYREVLPIAFVNFHNGNGETYQSSGFSFSLITDKYFWFAFTIKIYVFHSGSLFSVYISNILSNEKYIIVILYSYEITSYYLFLTCLQVI